MRRISRQAYVDAEAGRHWKYALAETQHQAIQARESAGMRDGIARQPIDRDMVDRRSASRYIEIAAVLADALGLTDDDVGMDREQ